MVFLFYLLQQLQQIRKLELDLHKTVLFWYTLYFGYNDIIRLDSIFTMPCKY